MSTPTLLLLQNHVPWGQNGESPRDIVNVNLHLVCKCSKILRILEISLEKLFSSAINYKFFFSVGPRILQLLVKESFAYTGISNIPACVHIWSNVTWFAIRATAESNGWNGEIILMELIFVVSKHRGQKFYTVAFGVEFLTARRIY